MLGDIADSPEIARHNKLLKSLCVVGRHAGVSVTTASPSDTSERYTASYISTLKPRGTRQHSRGVKRFADSFILTRWQQQKTTICYRLTQNIYEMFMINFTHQIEVD